VRTSPTDTYSTDPGASCHMLQTLLDGYCGTAISYIAAKLGLLDLLADGPQSSDALARSIGAHAPSLHGIMRGLVVLGVFSEGDDGRFGLTTLGECLQREIPSSLHTSALVWGEQCVGAWGSLKGVIHDWDDEESLAIPRHCHRALKGPARLLLVERVMPARAEQAPTVVLSDLHMLAMGGGRERTEAEYRALFAAAGVALTRVILTPSPFNVIEGVRSGAEESRHEQSLA
jgi:hypothetical protein